MNPNSLIPLVAAVAYGVQLVVIGRHLAVSRANRVFAIYLLAMTIWSFGSFMMHANTFVGTPLFWNKLMGIGTVAVPITFFYFVQLFLGQGASQKRWLNLGIVAYFIFQLMNFGGYIMKTVYVLAGELHYELGPGAGLVLIYWFFYLGFAIVSLVKQYRGETDKIQRNRLSYPLIGISLVTFGLLINLTPLGKYPIDIAANLLNALLLTYAIVRYELLEISVVVRKALAYVALTAVITAVYLVPILFFHQIGLGAMSELTLANFSFYLAIGVGIAVSIQPLHRTVSSQVDRWFFREQYDAYQMIQELSRQIAATLNLAELTPVLLNRIAETLHIERLGLILQDNGTKEFFLAGSRGIDMTETRVRWRPNHPIARWLTRRELILSHRQLGTLPQLRGLTMQELTELSRLEIALFVPLLTKDELAGILILGQKQSEEPYSSGDHRLLMTLANQVAIAVDNAHLYTEHKRTEARIFASLREKEILLKEIHHRVKNNMQTITSLLDLQAGQIDDTRLASILQESQTRIRSMALIHEHLYQSHDLANIHFSKYVDDLVGNLVSVYAIHSARIALNIETDDIFLDIDRAIPCGLIINELISNSLKYAFPPSVAEPREQQAPPRIDLRLIQNHQITLLIQDNGVGLAPDFDIHQAETLGLQLVDMLSSQLEGTLEIDRTGGTAFKLSFSGN